MIQASTVEKVFLYWGQQGDYKIFLSLTSGFREFALTFKIPGRMIINKKSQRLRNGKLDSSQGLSRGPDRKSPLLRVVGRTWDGTLLGVFRTIWELVRANSASCTARCIW